MLTDWLRRPRSSAVPVVRTIDGADRASLRAVVAEALIHQDLAEDVLTRICRDESLYATSRAAGPLVTRFFVLQERLPARCADPDDERIRLLLSSILCHHATLVSMALDLSAVAWRSERLRRQVQSIDGLGRPALLLEGLYAELTTMP